MLEARGVLTFGAKRVRGSGCELDRKVEKGAMVIARVAKFYEILLEFEKTRRKSRIVVGPDLNFQCGEFELHEVPNFRNFRYEQFCTLDFHCRRFKPCKFSSQGGPNFRELSTMDDLRFVNFTMRDPNFANFYSRRFKFQFFWIFDIGDLNFVNSTIHDPNFLDFYHRRSKLSWILLYTIQILWIPLEQSNLSNTPALKNFAKLSSLYNTRNWIF